MIDVICDRRSQSATELKYRLNQLPGDGWVNWSGRLVGDQVPNVLNRMSRSDKLNQLTWLQLQGVSVVPFNVNGPGEEGEWLGRLNSHQQGRDLVTRRGGEVTLSNPDYWTLRLFFPDEWRIHVWRRPCGKYAVVRSGIKLPKDKNAHPWVKSHRLGWYLSYIGGASEKVKEEAKKAVSALNLDFGAVDIGVREDGTPYVLEVNTCPGLEGRTLDLYVDGVARLLSR